MSTTGGRSPRDQGNRAERLVAKYLNGERVVGSGAYKFSNKNLLGDVDVYVDGRPYLKVEVKTTGRTHVKRGLYYIIPFTVLEQMQKEAEQYHQYGCLWIHFKNSSPADDIVVFSREHLAYFADGTGIMIMATPEKLENGKSTPIYRREVLDIVRPGGAFVMNGMPLRVTIDDVVHEYAIVLGQDVKYVLDRRRGEA